MASRGTARSLQVRNFRIYYYGQLASVCGTWTQTVALAWVVLELTDSGASVGTLTACQFVPVLLLGAWGGVIADRFDNRRAVMGVQVFLGLQAAVLAAVVLAGVEQLWVLYALAAVQGIGTAADTPTRQSLVGQLVPADDLPNALALNAGLVQLARIVGPVAAAALIALIGAGMCFAVNAASYVVVVLAVRALDRSELRARPRSSSEPIRVRDGLQYASARPVLRQLLLLTLLSSSASVTATVVLPVLARDTFDGNATVFGVLAACFGVGALVGAGFVASRRVLSRAQLVTTFAITGTAFLALAACPNRFVAAVPLVVAGFGSFTTGVTLNASIQLSARTEMRGRVIALFFLIAFGANVIAGPIYGVLTDAVGPRSAFVTAGALGLVTAAMLFVRWRDELMDPAAQPDVHDVVG